MKHFYTLAFLFSVALVDAFAAWDGTATIWTVGTGEENDPFIIENEQHLAYLRQTVGEDETYEGKFFRLAADLDMAGKVFNPIGIFDDYTLDGVPVFDSKPFLGTFDGDYHTIDNVTIQLANPNDDNELGGVGLFAVGHKETTVKNLLLGSGVTVNSVTYMTGAIMGTSEGATIENCSFAGNLTGGGGETGGIVGRADKGSVISGCINSGTIKANTSTGGIVGSSEEATITDCLNTGTVDGNEGFMIGGIIGWASNSSLKSCVGLGAVKGQVGLSFLPGISPVCAEFEKSTAENCYYVEALTGCDPLNSQKGISAVSADEMKSAEVLAALNGEGDAWVAAENDYPTLAWTFNTTAGISSAVADDAIAISAEGSNIVIKAQDGTYAVSDLSGRVIASGNVDGEYSFAPIARGYYVVTVRTFSGALAVAQLKL